MENTMMAWSGSIILMENKLDVKKGMGITGQTPLGTYKGVDVPSNI